MTTGRDPRRPPARSAPPGLCGTCRYSRRIDARNGAIYRLCERSASDPRFRRYPVLPMVECPGYEPADGS